MRNEARHEIHEQSLDAGKARRVLGWTPLWVLTRPDEGGDRHGLPGEVARRMRARRARRQAKEDDGNDGDH